MTLLSQVPHLRMSGLLLSASFPPKPHAEADIKITSAKPLTRFLEKKGLGEGVRMGRWREEEGEGKVCGCIEDSEMQARFF